MRVLVLSTVSAGNIPHRLIMPSSRYTRLVWYMEYARPEERPAPEGYDLVFNAIGDADLAEDSYAAVRRFLADPGKPYLNDPDRVAATRRDRLADLLSDIPDVVVPQTIRIRTEGPIDAREAAARHGVRAPFLLRPLGSHGGQGLRRIEGQDAEVLPAASEHYVTSYVDYAAGDGLFRKYRVIFVDGAPFPYHLAVGEHWMVHHATSGMTAFEARRAEELRFLEAPEATLGARAAAAIRRLGERLGLDYCGVDFSILPDGRVLVFEANATMLAHAEDEDGPYAAKNPYVMRIAEAFQALLDRRAQGAGKIL
jgi:glutathione synthase/RimK-type ligase-like ATP-grasp enzyme